MRHRRYSEDWPTPAEAEATRAERERLTRLICWASLGFLAFSMFAASFEQMMERLLP